jgi:recombinational DNA repair protein RecR
MFFDNRSKPVINLATLPNLGPKSAQMLALEGALSGRRWQEVAKHDRLRLLLALEDVENELKS